MYTTYTVRKKEFSIPPTKSFPSVPVLELFSSIKQIENSFAKEYSNL